MSIKPILLLTDTIDITIDIIDKLVKQNVVVNKKKTIQIMIQFFRTTII